MTLPSSGALSLNDVRGEFGGPTSNVAVNSYYRNGSFVYNVTKNVGVPTSGQIDFADWYGTEGAGPYAKGTAGTASTGGKLAVVYSGVDTVGQFTSTFGSWADASITVGSTARTVRTFMSAPAVGGPTFYFDYNTTVRAMESVYWQVYTTSGLVNDAQVVGGAISGTRETAAAAQSQISFGPNHPQTSSIPNGMPNSGTIFVQCNRGSFT